MREKLIAALGLIREQEAREQVKEMTDEQLEAVIAADLGLPSGTTFTTEQLEMIVRQAEA